jgi:putative glycosyltransferase (TIGR04372 family)
VKESAYYASITPESGYGQDLSHQAKDSRNVDISNYMLAATHLANLGIYVVRVGSTVGVALPKDRHPLIIDYATEARSQLGDLILGRNCKFFICGATGSFIFAAANNRPIIFVDFYFENRNDDPARRLDQLPNSILINRMYRNHDGYLLKFQSIIDQNIKLLLDSRLQEMNIFPVANSPTDILDAVSELNQIADGTYDETNTDATLQDKFYNCFIPPFPWRDYQLMRVANSFLRKYQDLL